MKFLLLALLGFNLSFAKTAARVFLVKGAAFHYGKQGEILPLKYSDKVAVGEKIMVDDHSSLELKTDDGAHYYVLGGSHIKLYTDGLELKNGKVWVKTSSDSKHKILQTANLKSIHSSGQFVYSFNNQTSKSQVVTIFGKATVSNLIEENFKTTVHSGEFSYVQNGKNDGFPRNSTRVGVNSYAVLKATFSNFKEIQNLNIEKVKSKKMRKIASVKSEKRIAFVNYGYEKEAKRNIASVQKHSKKRVKKEVPSAKVRIFGFKKAEKKEIPKVSYRVIPDLFKIESIKKPAMVKMPVKKENKARVPASVKEKRQPSSVKVKKTKQVNTVTVFEESLRKNIKIVPKHTKEVNQLIDELKSYEDDFVKEY